MTVNSAAAKAGPAIIKAVGRMKIAKGKEKVGDRLPEKGRQLSLSPIYYMHLYRLLPAAGMWCRLMNTCSQPSDEPPDADVNLRVARCSLHRTAMTEAFHRQSPYRRSDAKLR